MLSKEEQQELQYHNIILLSVLSEMGVDAEYARRQSAVLYVHLLCTMSVQYVLYYVLPTVTQHAFRARVMRT